MNCCQANRLHTIAGVLTLALPALLVVGSAAADIGATLVGLLFIVESARNRSWGWLRTPWIRVALGLWAWLLTIVDPLAFDPWQAYSSTLPWPRMILFAAALQYWVLDARWIRGLIWSTAATSLAVAADMLWQFVSGHDLLGHAWPGPDRLNGPFNRPKVGIYLSKLFFPAWLGLVTLATMAKHGRWRHWLVATLYAIVITVAVFLSGERMALLLIVLGWLVSGLFMHGLLRRLVIACLATAVMALVVLALVDRPMLSRQIDSTLATIEDLPTSHYGQIWRNSLHLFAGHPLTGIGPRNFKLACNDPILALPETQLPLRCATHSHNYYLEWLTETGATGLAGFLLLITCWLRQFWRSWSVAGHPILMTGPAIAVLVVLWPIATSGSFFTNWNEALFWFLLGWALAASRQVQPVEPMARARISSQ